MKFLREEGHGLVFVGSDNVAPQILVWGHQRMARRVIIIFYSLIVRLLIYGQVSINVIQIFLVFQTNCTINYNYV